MPKDTKEFTILRKFVEYLKERKYTKLQLAEATKLFYKFNPQSTAFSLKALKNVPGVEYNEKTQNICIKTNKQLREIENTESNNVSSSKNIISTNKDAIPLKKTHLLKTVITNSKLDVDQNFIQGEDNTWNIFHMEKKFEPTNILREMYRLNRKKFCGPNEWVTIEYNTDSIKEDLIVHNKKQTFCLNIVNQKNFVIYINLFELIPNKQINIMNSVPPFLKENEKIQIIFNITCTKQSLLLYPLFLILKQNVENDKIPHVSFKELVIRVQSPFVDKILPTAAYTPSQKTFLTYDDQPIIQDAPDLHQSVSRLKSLMALPEYPIPSGLVGALNAGLIENEHITPPIKKEIVRIRRLLQKPAGGSSPEDCLTEDKYAQVLHLLLHIEEYDQVKEISKYNKSNQKFLQVPGLSHLFELPVENLSEHRPSIVRGDRIIVSPELDLKEFFKFEGKVHEVRLRSIYVTFEKSFQEKYPHDTKYTVQFLMSRENTKKQHRAIQLIESHKKFLFPTVNMVSPLNAMPKLNFFNKLIEENEEQSEAVTNIVRGTSYPAPFLLFGPPGTGKTMTIVEAIKQINETIPKSHILVCAPSNSAANVLTERLIDHIQSTKDILRMMAVSQDWHNVPSSIKPYTNYDHKSQEFSYPSRKKLKTFRVIVITLMASSRLVSAIFPVGHFTHVFIDECGHATETEALVPIAGILTTKKNPNKIHGNIILAGDPMQLGPIITSHLAETYGLGISLLERLMNKVSLYQRDPITNKYDCRFLTKLINNFRSHAAILHLSNQNFYENELRPCASMENAGIALGWKKLPNKDFPIMFHASYATEERESNSPSYFNSSEIKLVMQYLGEIVDCKLNPSTNRVIKQNDIGIIAPYKKQIRKIQQRLDDKGLHNIVVGSVEQFQGEEKQVIIISTVRSRDSFDPSKPRSFLGFLRNPKRYNVALTRAKSLLIVIGNPNVLQYDENWMDLIDYCDNNRALINKQQYVRQ